MSSVLERAHPTAEDLPVEIRRNFLGSSEQSVEIVDQPGDRKTTIVDLPAQCVKRVAMVAHRRSDAALHSFESLIEIRGLLSNPLESTGGDHHLARELHHSLQPIGIDPNRSRFLILLS
jgi:hypothetical protein